MNPVLPGQYYIPDPEARVWEDGRLYIYGSKDEGGAEQWCSDIYRVFSTNDLIHWTDHGVSLRKEDIPFRTHRPLAAPDCVCKDGRYYLYFCMNGEGGREGVAESEHPAGPFRNPTQIAHTDQIDPAALVDDDGQAYFYWGQMSLCGARLNADMRSIQTDSLQKDLLTDREHGFHEGASIRKIGGLYYMVYCDDSRGTATCLSYAVSSHPLGPYEKKGVIIDNRNCGPLSWNIHGSLCQFQGRWYVFYHRSSRGGKFSRRVCVEPVEIREDGSIPEVEMTTQGTEAPIDARREIEAFRACFSYGRVHSVVADGEEFLTNAVAQGFVSYKYLRFSGQKECLVTVRGKGRLQLHLDRPYNSPFVIDVDSPDKWTTVPVEIPETEGELAVHFRFATDGVDFKSFRFV